MLITSSATACCNPHQGMTTHAFSLSYLPLLSTLMETTSSRARLRLPGCWGVAVWLSLPGSAFCLCQTVFHTDSGYGKGELSLSLLKRLHLLLCMYLTCFNNSRALCCDPGSPPQLSRVVSKTSWERKQAVSVRVRVGVFTMRLS